LEIILNLIGSIPLHTSVIVCKGMEIQATQQQTTNRKTATPEGTVTAEQQGNTVAPVGWLIIMRQVPHSCAYWGV
jgi:hypothetical protein